ncbi:MAG: SDR family oxidoreductase [Opitutales bacterium]
MSTPDHDTPKEPRIIITGASQGIGAALAYFFSRNLPGCRLALLARNERKLQAVADTLEAAPFFAGCDVSDEESVARAAEKLLGEWGAPNVLINNAGAFHGAPLLEFSTEAFDRILAVNVRGVFLVTKAFLPAMIERGSGDIFNMGSMAGLKVYPGGTGYCAAKFALTGMTRVMREELKDKGIRVTLISPGPTFTPSWEGTGIPEARMIPPEDIARAVFDVYRLSRRTVVEEITLQPQLGSL